MWHHSTCDFSLGFMQKIKKIPICLIWKLFFRRLTWLTAKDVLTFRWVERAVSKDGGGAISLIRLILINCFHLYSATPSPPQLTKVWDSDVLFPLPFFLPQVSGRFPHEWPFYSTSDDYDKINILSPRFWHYALNMNKSDKPLSTLWGMWNLLSRPRQKMTNM